MADFFSPTTFANIHPSIIQTHVLPLLDGPSLSTIAATSSYLHTLSSDDNLWSDICKSTWPSVIHPCVRHVISTFPSGHRSFFQDSFPTLITVDNQQDSPTSHPDLPPELISAVDIHYQNDIVYSRVKFSNTTTDFLSSTLCIEFNDDPDSDRPIPVISRPIDLKVDESTLSHLKESLTLNWILIDPTRKRAGNLSTIKPVAVRKDAMTNEIHLQYVTVLPRCDPNEMAQCRIDVRCAVGKGGVGLHVWQVMLQMQDMDYRFLGGREFLVITARAILEENNVRRMRVLGAEERNRRCKKFEDKMERVKWEEKKRKFVVKMNYVVLLVSFLLYVY